MRWNNKNSLNLTFGIRTKLLVCFLSLFIISFIIWGYIAFTNLDKVGTSAKQRFFSFGNNASEICSIALENVAKELMRNEAQHAAERIKNYLSSKSEVEYVDIMQDTSLLNIAFRPFSGTGYTYIYEEKNIYDLDSALTQSSITNKNVLNDQIYWLNLSYEKDGMFCGRYYWKNSNGREQERFIYIMPLGGTKYFASLDETKYLTQGGGRLMVAASLDTDEFIAPSRKIYDSIASVSSNAGQYIDRQKKILQTVSLVSAFCMLIFAGGIASLVARRITRPILALAEGSKIIAQGNFNHRLKIQTGDEIEKLSMQFNKMAATLEKSYDELEQRIEERTKSERRRSSQLRLVNEVGRGISSILSIDKLLSHVVDSISRSFNFYNINIFTIEPNSGKLILKASTRGQRGNITIGSPLDKNSLVWQAIESGELTVINNSKFSSSQDQSELKCEVAVPISIGAEIFGVMDIENIEQNNLDEIDFFTMQTLADQIAVAIKNASLYEETRELAILEERNRLAREIHDTLAQGLVAIILQIEASEQTLSEDLADARKHMDRARSLPRECLAEARRSVWALHPQTTEQPSSLVENLRYEINNFTSDTGIRVNINILGKIQQLYPDIESTLLRICKESLNNVAKHAKASQVGVSLIFGKEMVKLGIHDNGVGFDPKGTRNSNSFGLISMRERAQLLGGSLRIKSEEGMGTLIEISVPTNGR